MWESQPEDRKVSVLIVGWQDFVKGKTRKEEKQATEEFRKKIFFDGKVRFDVIFEGSGTVVPPASKLAFPHDNGEIDYAVVANPSILLGQTLLQIAHDEHSQSSGAERSSPRETHELPSGAGPGQKGYRPFSPSWRELELLYRLERSVEKHPDDAIDPFLISNGSRTDIARTDIAQFLSAEDLQKIKVWADLALASLDYQAEVHRRPQQEYKRLHRIRTLFREDSKMLNHAELDALNHFSRFLRTADHRSLEHADVQKEEQDLFPWFPQPTEAHQVRKRRAGGSSS
ncbi:hypothetical protein JCM3766R1_006793 [Sporobolomyces carnicolor]